MASSSPGRAGCGHLPTGSGEEAPKEALALEEASFYTGQPNSTRMGSTRGKRGKETEPWGGGTNWGQEAAAAVRHP